MLAQQNIGPGLVLAKSNLSLPARRRHCIMLVNCQSQPGGSMTKRAVCYLIALVILSVPAAVFAQAFGEYGRAVGSVPHGPGITGGRTSGGGSQGGVGGAGVGDLGGRAMARRLVVAAKNAGLFPRQDEESDKIAQLSEGENLLPMVQSEGNNQWYMVKTEKGLVGWVKSADVRQEPQKK
jgi:hypothetical protein